MASRDILHRSKLDDFKDYLTTKGWVIQDTKGIYEVLRAINPEVQKRPLIIYDGKSKEHLSVDDRDFGIVRDYINSRKRGEEMTLEEIIKGLYRGDCKAIKEAVKVLDKCDKIQQIISHWDNVPWATSQTVMQATLLEIEDVLEKEKESEE